MTTQDSRPGLHAALMAMTRKDLDTWRRVHDSRNERIRSAYAAGLSVNEITRRTGLAKTTVLRILSASS